MRLAVFPAGRQRRREPIGERGLALLLVIAIHIGLALLILLLTPDLPQKLAETRVFELLPTLDRPKPKQPPAKSKAAAKKKVEKAPSTTPVPVVKAPETPDKPKLFDKLLVDGFDISKVPNRKAEQSAEADSTGADSQTAYGPGEGPGGAQLFNAEWQREPTNAELAFYLPRGAPRDSWAVIACKTAERFRVEDCRILGESPPGSGLARGVSEAAWQFRVLPPRIGGKAQIGAWVRIRFTFSDSGAAAG